MTPVDSPVDSKISASADLNFKVGIAVGVELVAFLTGFPMCNNYRDLPTLLRSCLKKLIKWSSPPQLAIAVAVFGEFVFCFLA